jgi:hypothetical protein
LLEFAKSADKRQVMPAIITNKSKLPDDQEEFYNKVEKNLSRKRNHHSEYTTNRSLYNSQNVSSIFAHPNIKPLATNRHHKIGSRNIKVVNNATTRKLCIVSNKKKDDDNSSGLDTNKSAISSMQTMSIENSSNLNSTTYNSSLNITRLPKHLINAQNNGKPHATHASSQRALATMYILYIEEETIKYIQNNVITINHCMPR